MKISRQEQVATLREEYPEGTRIMLLKMEDPFTQLQRGDMGNVTHVDDAGQIHMIWDNGSSLALVPGEDEFMKLE